MLLADGRAIVALHRQLHRLEAATTRATATFDARRAWEADGALGGGLVGHALSAARPGRPPAGAPGAGPATGRPLNPHGRPATSDMPRWPSWPPLEPRSPRSASPGRDHAGRPSRPPTPRTVRAGTRLLVPDGRPRRCRRRRCRPPRGALLPPVPGLRGGWFAEACFDPSGGAIVARTRSLAGRVRGWNGWCSTVPTGSRTSACAGASSPAAPGGPWRCATGSASTSSATSSPSGARSTTSDPGPRVVSPPRPTADRRAPSTTAADDVEPKGTGREM